ncbi:major facilitator superfamily domain-containing protein 6-A-like [Dreissena polymorpha]|uniref:Major facilitator superfamily (MFS) profile domain-containing protein n=1 Tax=Dreissena polymorpha TaxID=45954 RepID=A0A9D4RJQ9_DREPO|nr:major facilitator superfamily domain-containing protein 6-A-like [Dreissena polymorpha]XP_052265311.1 major facilitator superfamily domain-containing protein 6-A-like [Dreissena polymorpha]KAH3868725.1 hypothetical protein DPMN_031877 [Dreissena polymorpha]
MASPGFELPTFPTRTDPQAPVAGDGTRSEAKLAENSPIHSISSDGSSDKTVCCKCLPSDFFKIDRVLLKFKAFYFFFAAAIGCVFPYFSVYFKQLGFSPNQIGIVAGVRPIIGFCSGSILGSIADRFRIRRIMLSCSAVGWLLFITSIGFVPTAKHSDAQCLYVAELLSSNRSNISTSIYQNATNTNLREHFFEMHKSKPHFKPEGSLQESRGWVYDVTDLQNTFVTIMVLVILGELVQSPTGALADSGCIEQLGGDGIDKYGRQRAFGSLGLGIFSLLAGGLVSLTRRQESVCNFRLVFSDYRIAFYLFAGCMACCFICTLFFKFQKQTEDQRKSRPRPNPLRVFRMFLTLHYGSWLFCMLFTGVCNGVIWGFLFWHLENIGATQILLGVANGVSLFSEMCMFLVVFRILQRTGCLPFMTVGLLGYAVRFVVFASIDNPWVVLPFEILQGFTFAGVWSVYVKYLCKSVPSEYLGTLQGFLHGVYWGLGAGSGHMIGGILVQTLGARMTFWIFAAGSFVNMVLFLIIQKFTVRPNIFGHYEELDEAK